MYSEEIKALLEYKQYVLDVEEYFKILNTSPQISNVCYKPYEDEFHIGTDDNYEFNFKIKRMCKTDDYKSKEGTLKNG